VSDGAGGAVVVWQDNRCGHTMVADTYAAAHQRFGALCSGHPDGVAVCTAANKQTNRAARE
jgi:hypothetical protein